MVTPSQPVPPEQDRAHQTEKIFRDIKAALDNTEIARAEALREKLIEINPMALTEIIKSAELIENTKTANRDKDHFAIWDKLYSTLSEEEKNGLFYNMKKIIVPAKKILLSKGSFNSRLFFIDRGRVSICQPKGNRHVVLAQLGRGDILGEYTFATIALCSATAVTSSEVHLMYLENSATAGWNETHPELYNKLIDFCMKNGQVDEILRRKKSKKLHATRYTVSGQVAACLLDRNGKKTDTRFRGNLSELSVSGTSFEIKCSNKETARALLGKKLLLTFHFKKENTTIKTVGKIVEVTFHLYNDYSLHIQFVNKLPEKQIIKICRRPN
jgi:CRP-like cAMP-binding protein